MSQTSHDQVTSIYDAKELLREHLESDSWGSIDPTFIKNLTDAYLEPVVATRSEVLGEVSNGHDQPMIALARVTQKLAKIELARTNGSVTLSHVEIVQKNNSEQCIDTDDPNYYDKLLGAVLIGSESIILDYNTGKHKTPPELLVLSNLKNTPPTKRAIRFAERLLKLPDNPVYLG